MAQNHHGKDYLQEHSQVDNLVCFQRRRSVKCWCTKPQRTPMLQSLIFTEMLDEQSSQPWKLKSWWYVMQHATVSVIYKASMVTLAPSKQSHFIIIFVTQSSLLGTVKRIYFCPNQAIGPKVGDGCFFARLWHHHLYYYKDFSNWLFSSTQILLINTMQREPSHHAVTITLNCYMYLVGQQLQ